MIASASGVAQAQAGDLDAAERTLTESLACPGPSALRELAGVRLLQRRWDEVAQLSMQAASIDPADDYSWKLLRNQPVRAQTAAGRVDAGITRVNRASISCA